MNFTVKGWSVGPISSDKHICMLILRVDSHTRRDKELMHIPVDSITHFQSLVKQFGLADKRSFEGVISNNPSAWYMLYKAGFCEMTVEKGYIYFALPSIN